MGQEESTLDQSETDVTPQPGSEQNPSFSTSQTSKSAESRVGDILFGKYRVRELIQDDEVSSTFRGRDLATNEKVLIETIKKPEWWPIEKKTFTELSLNHPNILNLIAVNYSDEGQPFFFSEYPDFVRLNDLVENSGFIEQEAEVFDTLSQICQALSFAHERGIAHGYIHPRNVFLIDEEGAVKVKLGNFGLARPRRSDTSKNEIGISEKSGVQQDQSAARVEDDIVQLSVLAFFLLSGQAPHKDASLDQIYESFAAIKLNFHSLADHRPDLRGWDELAQLFEDAMEADEAWRIKTVKEFEDGLSDWLQAVNSSSRQSQLAEKVAATEEEKPTVLKKKKKTTNNMRTTVKQMVNLKANQANQEETAVMRLADIAAVRGGPRRSPLVSALQLLALVGAVLGTISIVTYAFVFKPDETEEAWRVTSRWVASLFSRKAKESADAVDDGLMTPDSVLKNPSVKKGTARKNAGTSDVPGHVASASNDPAAKAPNKLPPFNHTVLRDFYNPKFVPDGTRKDDSKRRRFRIEYREFNRDWLK